MTDATGKLTGLLTLKDTRARGGEPQRLQGRIWAACGSRRPPPWVDAGFERSEALIDAGCDLIVIDTAHGHSEGRGARGRARSRNCRTRCRWWRGNVATAEATRGADSGAGADAIKVGIGPGSICTTRVVAGRGRAANWTADLRIVPRPPPQAGTPVDRGWRHQDLGRLRQGDRRGGALRHGGQHDRRHRRGAGRGDPLPGPQLQGLSAAWAASARWPAARRTGISRRTRPPTSLVRKGSRGRCLQGPAGTVIHQLIGGLRAAMGYTGCATVDEMRGRTAALCGSPGQG